MYHGGGRRKCAQTRRRPRNDDGARRCLLTLCDRAFYSVHPTTATAMQGYNPAPPPAGTPVHHQQVAQHLAANIPGFGDPTGLKFRGAVRATTAFGHPPPGGGAAAPAPAGPTVGGYAPPAYAAAPAHSAPAYYGAPAAGAPVSLPLDKKEAPSPSQRPAVCSAWRASARLHCRWRRPLSSQRQRRPPALRRRPRWALRPLMRRRILPRNRRARVPGEQRPRPR